MASYLKTVTVQEKAILILWFLETKSVIKTQRHYTIVIQFGKDPPSASAI
jgi:hypothetical protein